MIQLVAQDQTALQQEKDKNTVYPDQTEFTRVSGGSLLLKARAALHFLQSFALQMTF